MYSAYKTHSHPLEVFTSYFYFVKTVNYGIEFTLVNTKRLLCQSENSTKPVWIGFNPTLSLRNYIPIQVNTYYNYVVMQRTVFLE